MFQESRQGAVTVIGTAHALTCDTASEAAGVLERCAAQGPPMTVFDMAGVPLLDSAGLELLLNAHRAFEQRGGAFKVAAANSLCLDALYVTGVAEQLEVFDDVNSAVRSFLQ